MNRGEKCSKFCWSRSGGKSKLFLSVIVTAHDRKHLLLSALISVLSQKLDRSCYEIILVKNFIDSDLETLINENNILTIFSNSNLGLKIKEGLKASQGEVVTFLEDDDLYEPERLSRIREVFMDDQSVVYYHNASCTIDENGQKLEKNYYRAYNGIRLLDSSSLSGKELKEIHKFSVFNQLSSIAVRKNAFVSNADLVERIYVAADRFIFFSSVENGGRIFIDGNALTRYRFHDSLSNPIGDNNMLGVKVSMIASRKLEDYSIILSLRLSDGVLKLAYIGLLEAITEDRVFRSTRNAKRREIIHLTFSLFYLSLSIGSFAYLKLSLVSFIDSISHGLTRTLLTQHSEAKIKRMMH